MRNHSNTARKHSPSLFDNDNEPKPGRVFPLLPGMTGDALFAGDNNEYRLWLSRWWGDRALGYVLSIGMNPSKARHDVDDPTVRRDIQFAQREGAGGLYKVNILALCATEPQDMIAPGAVPFIHANVETIRRLARDAKLIILCCGILPKELQSYADDMIGTLRGDGRVLWCLGKTAHGHARHSLYIKGDKPLERF